MCSGGTGGLHCRMGFERWLYSGLLHAVVSTVHAVSGRRSGQKVSSH